MFAVRRHKTVGPTGLALFSREDGTAISLQAFQEPWQRLKTKHPELRSVTLHALRHMLANRLAAAGVPEGTIEQIMGHSSVEMVRHYARQYDAQLKAAVEGPRFPDVLGP